MVSNDSYISCAAQLTTRIILRPEGRSKARIGHGEDVAGGIKTQELLVDRE